MKGAVKHPVPCPYIPDAVLKDAFSTFFDKLEDDEIFGFGEYCAITRQQQLQAKLMMTRHNKAIVLHFG